jgi:hypothetical protein
VVGRRLDPGRDGSRRCLVRSDRRNLPPHFASRGIVKQVVVLGSGFGRWRRGLNRLFFTPRQATRFSRLRCSLEILSGGCFRRGLGGRGWFWSRLIRLGRERPDSRKLTWRCDTPELSDSSSCDRRRFCRQDLSICAKADSVELRVSAAETDMAVLRSGFAMLASGSAQFNNVGGNERHYSFWVAGCFG